MSAALPDFPPLEGFLMKLKHKVPLVGSAWNRRFVCSPAGAATTAAARA